ncbi:MAG TPA: STAS domain-containing protein [Candidatus Baltobacteraceae bacterium]|jgi:anti-anti-sigma factor
MHDGYSDFSVKVTKAEGTIVVSLSGDWDVYARDALHDALSCTGSRNDVVIDARRASFFDSSALSEFVTFFKRVTEQGQRFELLVGNSNILRILEMTGLSNVLLPSPDRIAMLQERIIQS